MSADALERLEKRVLEAGYSFFVKVKGASMLPFLREGDEIEIKKAGRKALKVGAIVVFDQGSFRVVHRVVDIKFRENEEASVFITRGDAGVRADQPVLARHILGVVAGYKRGGRYFKAHYSFWSLSGFWYAQYKLFKTRAGRFMLRTQRNFLLKQVYFGAYQATARFIEFLFMIFGRGARVYIKTPEDVKTFIPGASDIDLWVVFDRVDRGSKEYEDISNLARTIENIIPLVQGPTKVFDSIELCNHMSWGGCLRQSFMSGRYHLDPGYTNKLSSFALKISMFDVSFFWVKAVFSELGSMDIHKPVCFADPVVLKIAKAFLKILNCHEMILGGDGAFAQQKMREALTKEISLDRFSKIDGVTPPVDFLKAIDHFFKDPDKKQNICFQPKDALLFLLELLDASAFLLLSSFKDSFSGAHDHIMAYKGRNKLFIEDGFYSFNAGDNLSVLRKVDFFNVPALSSCYIARDDISHFSRGEFMAALNLNAAPAAMMILKEDALFCLLMDLRLRPSWLSAIKAPEEKERLKEMYRYGFLRMDGDRNYHAAGRDDVVIREHLVPSLKMLYLGIKHSIVVHECTDIEREFVVRAAREGHGASGLTNMEMQKMIRDLHVFIHQEGRG